MSLKQEKRRGMSFFSLFLMAYGLWHMAYGFLSQSLLNAP